MKSALKSLITSAGLVALLPLVASAERFTRFPFPFPKAVPELDPSLATTALSLLIGGVLVLTGRRRNGR